MYLEKRKKQDTQGSFVRVKMRFSLSSHPYLLPNVSYRLSRASLVTRPLLNYRPNLTPARTEPHWLSCASSHPHQPLMPLCLVAQGACHYWGTCLFPQLQALPYSSFYNFILITSWMTHSHLIPVFSHSRAPHEAGMLSVTSSHTSL